MPRIVDLVNISLYKSRMTAKQKQSADDLRSKILKSAADIISKGGIRKLTMRSLGDQVGVSRTASYRHFQNKDALLMAIAEEGFSNLTLRYREINNNKSLDSLSKIQSIGLAYVEFAVRNPGAFRLMFGQEIIQYQRSEKLCLVTRDTFIEYLKAVKALQEENDMSTEDYSILANNFWTIVHGLAVLLIDGQIQVSGENYGLPTLFSGEKPNVLENLQAMMTFSKKAIMNFCDIVLYGVSKDEKIASPLNHINGTPQSIRPNMPNSAAAKSRADD